MTTTEHDHREDIANAAVRYSDDVTTDDLFDGGILDVTVWRDSSHDPDTEAPARVEFLLACGGPTVRVEVDQRWESVTFFHSWGRNSYGDDLTELDLGHVGLTDERDTWLELAEYVAEVA